MDKEQKCWFQPDMPERGVFDIAVYAGTPGNPEGFEGTEALRRNLFEHSQWVKTRKPGDDWIAPLVSVGCIDMSRSSPRCTDVLEPLARDTTEFLPVDVVDGDPLYWVFAPRVPGALNWERSDLSQFEGRITSLDRPVLNAEAIPDTASFLSLSIDQPTPVVSQPIAEAIKGHDLFGVDLFEVEVL